MDKYVPCRWMTSFVYLRNLATSDIPISGFPGCGGAYCFWVVRPSVLLSARSSRFLMHSTTLEP